MAELDRYK